MADIDTIFNPQRRIWILALASILLFAGIIARLVHLQILQHEYFIAVAEGQRQRASELRPHRGTIYMSDSTGGETVDDIFPVATNQQRYIIYAVPRDIEDPQRVADELAPALVSFRRRQEERTRRIVTDTGQASPTPAAE